MVRSKLPRIISISIGFLLLLNTIVMPFVLNFNVGLILLSIYSAVLILYGVFFDKIKQIKIMHIFVIGLSFVLILFSSFLAVYGSIDTVQGDEKFIVVLGSGIRGEEVPPNLANRLDKAVEFSTANPDSVIIVSGGQGVQEDISEAEAMKRYLISEGVPSQKVIKEDKATSTCENFVFSKEIIDKIMAEDSSICFITNDYHIFRAEKYAASLGMDVTHIGASTVWYSIPVNYMREILAITKLFLTMILN